MHESLVAIVEELRHIGDAVRAIAPADVVFSISQGNWSFPGISRNELIGRADALSELITTYAKDPADTSVSVVKGLVDRLTFLRVNTIPQLMGNGALAIAAYLTTLEAVEGALAPLLKSAKEAAQQNTQLLKDAASKIRAMETRIRDLTPRTASVEDMVGRIESAYEAADQLPTDLETLRESQKKVRELLAEAEKDRSHILSSRESVEQLETRMKTQASDAAAILTLCESAYSSATSVGLAAAFSERSKSLDWSMWAWASGLVIALVTGGVIGSHQLSALTTLIASPDKASGALVWINVALALLSVGGPIWFSWLATKQVGQRFRLSEDYAFKASISRAYEGYRRETVKIDKQLEVKLLRSALERLDEQPLRLVEAASYGSPWHEMLASDAVKTAAKSIPGFVDAVAKFASESLSKAKVAPAQPKPIAAVESGVAGAEGETA